MFKVLVVLLLVANVVLGVCVYRLSRRPRIEIEVTFNDTKKNESQDSLIEMQHRDISLLQAQIHRVASVLWNRLNIVKDSKSQAILRSIVIMFADSIAMKKIKPGKKLIIEEGGQ